MVGPRAELLGLEPEGDLVVGGLNRVGAVADVSADVNAEVTADSAGIGVERLSGTEHLTAGEDGVGSLPNHAADGSGDHVFNEAFEEALAGEIRVMLLHVLLAGRADLHGDELESLLLEAGDDLADESALDAIGLDHDVGSFSLGGLHLCLE